MGPFLGVVYIGEYTVYDYGDHVLIEPPNESLKEELESYGEYRQYFYKDYFTDDYEDSDNGFDDSPDVIIEDHSPDVPIVMEAIKLPNDWEPEEVMWILEESSTK